MVYCRVGNLDPRLRVARHDAVRSRSFDVAVEGRADRHQSSNVFAAGSPASSGSAMIAADTAIFGDPSRTLAPGRK